MLHKMYQALTLTAYDPNKSKISLKKRLMNVNGPYPMTTWPYGRDGHLGYQIT